MKISIIGIGTINALGVDVDEMYEALLGSHSALKPITSFRTPHTPLPVGQVNREFDSPLPRSHSLALHAANELFRNCDVRPDAIVLGTTTGGIDVTEDALGGDSLDEADLSYHGNGTIAQLLAETFECKGPVITISTACSSGTAALGIGYNLLRQGSCKNVLVGGVDAICKLTYYGFNALQLIDPGKSKPFDIDRNGMSVAEGAAMLMLSSEGTGKSLCEVTGFGMTCDAYHPASPHPEGTGALGAMKSALDMACLKPEDVSYINLHGTGTVENDKSEALALNRLYSGKKPYSSSVKGATGHPLGAAGGIEAVIAALCLQNNFIPANIGCQSVDETLQLEPLSEPNKTEVIHVLSNSFGFGGNNATVVFSKNNANSISIPENPRRSFYIEDASCITGSGFLQETIESLDKGQKTTGLLDKSIVSENLPKKDIRRIKRLSRMALSLADRLMGNGEKILNSVYLGTAWGAVTETYDFLTKLYNSNEELSSPTDFVGSVHNAPAGQVAIKYKAEGKNITTTGGDSSFDQALFTASLLSDESDRTLMVCGIDEYHEPLSHALEPSLKAVPEKSDGGGALLLSQDEVSDIKIQSLALRHHGNESALEEFIAHCQEYDNLIQGAGALFMGLPGRYREKYTGIPEEIIKKIDFNGAIINYRDFLGEYTSVSAVAASLAFSYLKRGDIPHYIISSGEYTSGTPILILNMGEQLSLSVLYRQ